MADKFKYVTIKEQEYQIGKFGAREGAFIAMKVAGIIAPMASTFLKDANPKKAKSTKKPSDLDLNSLDISALIAPLASISEADFSYLQEKSLSVCKVKLKAGYISVVNDNGSLAVEDLEDDSATIMALMVHALMHNLAGFFQGSQLSGFFGGLLASNQQS